MDTKWGKPRWGGDGGVLNWAIGIVMYTLMCVKLMTHKKAEGTVNSKKVIKIKTALSERESKKQ